ncbi:MAG: hypothetical protein ACE15C_19860, partial [Phycisphaerae bacterium]
MTHVAGTPLLVAAGQEIVGTGTINDFVTCQGTITASVGSGMHLTRGLLLSVTGYVDLGSGTLVCSWTASSLRDSAYLGAQSVVIDTGNEVFAQSGGVNICRGFAYVNSGTYVNSGGIHIVGTTLSLGDSLSDSGAYQLGGTGLLTACDERLGYVGAGTFIRLFFTLADESAGNMFLSLY